MCFTTSDGKTTQKEIDRAANQVHKFKLILKLQKKLLIVTSIRFHIFAKQTAALA